MPNDCQQSIDNLWDKYRLALQRLDWALDQLNKQVSNNVVTESDPNEVSIDDFVIGDEEATDPGIAVKRGLDNVVRYQNKNYNMEAFKGLHPTLPIYSVKVKADNDTVVNTAECGFGNQFPMNPNKGNMYIRTDFLPNRLYKWNNKKWIELDKSTTDSYTYNEAYIQHLVDKLQSGEYTADDLNDAELDQIQQIVGKNGLQ
jgi:hypothetical protein|tara:strand:- start:666 stop:1268 length:603 start_codon:yes stop_codon:yes gene_type:complete